MNIIRKIVKSQLLVGFLSFVFFWEIIYLVIQTHTIPSPIETFVYLFTSIDELLLHSFGSIGRVVASYEHLFNSRNSSWYFPRSKQTV